MLNLIALTLIHLHAADFADMVFTKGGRPPLKLQMTARGRARVTRGRKVLVQGRLKGQDSVFEIETREGEICPPVKIELVHEVQQPRGMGAEVTIDFASVDGQARRACARLKDVPGSYARIR